jgi:dTDP-glucose 4,6-dehydratase
MKSILVTGGNGLVASQFIAQVIRETDWTVYTTFNGNPANINRLFDVTDEFSDDDNNRIVLSRKYNQYKKYDIIVHLAAATDVGESINNPMKYVEQNVIETAKILEFARTIENLEKFIFISSNEVFGPSSSDDADYFELDAFNPHTPYAGTKAAAEQLCLSYYNTYKLPINIVRTMNVFGERQTSNRFFSLCIRKILNDEEITVYDNLRTYIHAQDVADGIMFILRGEFLYPSFEHEGCPRYHIVGNKQVNNLWIVKEFGKALGIEPKYEVEYTGRVGYENRYSMSGAKLYSMGWEPKATLSQRIEQMALWSRDNRGWIDG